MGQETCCKIEKTANDEITHQLPDSPHNSDNENHDNASLSINQKSHPNTLSPISKPSKDEQLKKKRIQNFYGTLDCTVTKTMTKQLVIPELERKINKFSASVIEECTEENSRTGVESCQGMNTEQLIRYKARTTLQEIEKNIAGV